MILEDAYVRFLIKHNITQSQFLCLYLIYKGRPDLIKEYKTAFPSDDDTMIGKYMLDDLIKKNLLKVSNNKYELTKEFYSIFINKHIATDEIYSIYPTYVVKDGVNLPLTAMDRNIFANIYDEAIMSSKLEHFEVIEDIKFAVKENLINMGIEKFLKSQQWKAIRPLRLENVIKEQTFLKSDNEF